MPTRWNPRKRGGPSRCCSVTKLIEKKILKMWQLRKTRIYKPPLMLLSNRCCDDRWNPPSQPTPRGNGPPQHRQIPLASARTARFHQLLAPGNSSSKHGGFRGRHAQPGPWPDRDAAISIGRVIGAMVWKPLSSMERPNGGTQARRPPDYPPPPAAALSATPMCWCGALGGAALRDPAVLQGCSKTFHPAHLPTFRPKPLALDWLEPVPGRSFCEWERCGPFYFDLVWWERSGSSEALWHYPEANSGLRGLAEAGYCPYPAQWTACWGWRAGTPQQGGSIAAGITSTSAARSREIRSTRN